MKQDKSFYLVDGSSWLAADWTAEKICVSDYFEAAKEFKSREEAKRLQRDLNDHGYNFRVIGISEEWLEGLGGAKNG